MSNALVDNIGNASGSLVTPTQYVVRGSAKAWANLNGTGTIALRDSLNVSSVVDNGTGDYGFNFASSFSSSTSFGITGMAQRSATAAPSAGVSPSPGPGLNTGGPSSVRLISWAVGSGGAEDSTMSSFSTHGDLA